MQGAPGIRGYEITRPLESSSTMDSWEAVQISLDRTVMILTPRGGQAAGGAADSSFEDLARLYARLRHPMFVPVMDIGRAEDGTPYAVLERVEGETLAAALAAGPFSPARAANVAAALCEGLDAAWKQASVVFRGIKPSNILLCPGDDVRYWAFQTIWNAERPSESMARDAGALVGTPSYMAPEQAECSASLDFRTDMYAVGAVFYQMLTGNPPFGDAGDMLAIVEKQRTGTLPAPTAVRGDIPASYSHVALRLMAKALTDRYDTGASALEDLRRIASGRQPVALSRGAAFIAPPSTVAPYSPESARKAPPPTAAPASADDRAGETDGASGTPSTPRKTKRIAEVCFAVLLLAALAAGLCRIRIATMEKEAPPPPSAEPEAFAGEAPPAEAPASGYATPSGTRAPAAPSTTRAPTAPTARTDAGNRPPTTTQSSPYGRSYGQGASSSSSSSASTSRPSSPPPTYGGYTPYDPVAAATSFLFSDLSRIIRTRPYPKCISDAKDAIRRVGTRQPQLEKKCKALWTQIDGMQPWEDLVGLALASSPRERAVELEGKQYHIRKPTGYIRPNLLCDVLGADGQWVTRPFPINRLSTKEMFSMISALPADRSPQALISRALLTLREGTAMEFREFVERFDVKPLKPLAK